MAYCKRGNLCVIADVLEIAGEFRQHFSVCGTRLVADTFGAYFEGPSTKRASVSSSLVVLDVTPSEVECVFGTMKCDASPGLDVLPQRLLKGCRESLLEVMAYLRECGVPGRVEVGCRRAGLEEG
ncbi:hypothetical protein QE152_g26047 [Popillia japonica]|uniref:Uncharacterized protein n=1 Tax=Popillia japonica TaxID=7064 RepID=A0AAW1K061_POPJA